ncbi:hypothetical protein EZV61_14420 [Corallincola luteus]|uniref:VWFA domain-containing protein n=1 Tax=Corallincola luteus TaxID=1775177 RepID=A0ABY2AIL7_9GAMM|nr:PilC/PilY family type IV pilus protein [Corallincola luteus]TCI02133.1 hypothetical protein EZV61_14420 [Corallincola luteus]
MNFGIKNFKRLAIAVAACLSTVVVADDTELFVKEISSRTGFRPQILLVFDTSGSMRTNSVSTKQFFDEEVNYPTSGYFEVRFNNSTRECRTSSNGSWSSGTCGTVPGFNGSNIYWVKGNSSSGEPPELSGNNQKFKGKLLNCRLARDTIAEQGFFSGYLRQYKYSGNDGSWEEFPDEDVNGTLVGGVNSDTKSGLPIDCFADIEEGNNKNNGKMKDHTGAYVSTYDGFPVDGQGDPDSRVYWDNSGSYVNNTAFGLGEAVTLYSENYLRWHHNDSIANKSYTRMQIAQESMTNVIGATLSADFGLLVFNHNDGSDDTPSLADHGGRIIAGIKSRTNSQTSDLQDLINGLYGDGYTPLCEATYEAYRYLAGKNARWGNDESRNWNTTRYPNPDYTIRAGGVSSGAYLDPYKECSGDTYIILMSDGDPVRDNALNGTLSGEFTGLGGKVHGNYLPALTKWMATNDVNALKEGDQKVTTYTVGFGTGLSSNGKEILKQAGEGSGGRFFTAENTTQLQAKLLEAIVEILGANANVTSPAVATDSSDRTQILDNLYYAVFSPSETARWAGNLKKLKLNDSGTDVVDRKGAQALDPEGGIKDGAFTFWSQSSSADGGAADKGGVAETLTANAGSRALKFNDGLGSLKVMNRSNLQALAGSQEQLASHMQIAVEDIDTVLSFLQGIDTEDQDTDGSRTDARKDSMGDPMHARPVAINYGDDDIRILLGTNTGFVHLFKDNGNTVEESWAFMPFELLPRANLLRKNTSSTPKVYGMDVTATVYKEDPNSNGKVDAGEKVIAYLGMRRGGSSYYALDISDPDAPKLLWTIDGDSAGFGELAQTWSKPTVGFLRNVGANKPVLFFGAGYSVNKDTDGVGTNDSTGRGIYAVDGLDGSLIFSFTPAATTSKNVQMTGMTDSFPGEVATLDSVIDGFVDRLYAADTGGNIWRFDFPEADKATWGGFKFASVGGDVAADDRRFFTKPVITRTYYDEITKETVDSVDIFRRRELPADFVLLGSGDIPSPLGTDTNDYQFMLQDNYIQPTDWNTETPPSTIAIADMYHLNIAQTAYAAATTDEEKLSVLAGYTSDFRGCYISHGVGEKIMGPSRVLAGYSLHTTFTPGEESQGCKPGFGVGRLYISNLCRVNTTLTSFNVSTLPMYDAPTIVPPKADADPDTTDRPQLLLPGGVKDVLCEGGQCADDDGNPIPTEPPGTALFNLIKHNTHSVEKE